MITNCFKKAIITSETRHATIADSDDPIKDLNESLDSLKAADPDILPEGFSAENIIDVGHDVIATVPCITESNKDGNDCDNKTVNDVAP